MKSLIIRVVRQITNDKRTLAMLIFAPLFVLSLIYLLLGNNTYTPKISLKDHVQLTGVKEALERQGAVVVDFPQDRDVDGYLKNKEADAVLWMDGGLHIRMLESDAKVSSVMEAVKNAMSGKNADAKMEPEFVYASEADNTFDSMGYVFLGILSFFFVFIISGMALVKERSAQTLERMLMTPVKRWEVVSGYTVGFGIFAALQSTLMVLYARYVLGLTSAGSTVLCVLVMVLLAFTAVALGALASIFANSEFQVVQFIPVIIVPQIFFSGLIPLDTISWGLGNLCYIMPVYYGAAALRMIMVEGAGLAEIWPWLLAVTGYFLLLSVLNTVSLKKYRRL